MLSWQNRAKETREVHRSNLIANADWTILKTAKQLRRSYGSINEDLTIASWLDTHGVAIEKMKSIEEALIFIRKKRKEMRIR